MLCVEIELPIKDRLLDEMTNMRIWLDHQRLEPATFREIKTISGMVFHVYFEKDDEARRFAAAFGGRVQNESRFLAS